MEKLGKLIWEFLQVLGVVCGMILELGFFLFICSIWVFFGVVFGIFRLFVKDDE